MRKTLTSWNDDCQSCGIAIELVVETPACLELVPQAWTCPQCEALRVVDFLRGEIVAVKRRAEPGRGIYACGTLAREGIH
jgi:hypothetical protein